MSDVVAVLARARVPLGFACAGAVLWLAQPSLQSLAIGGAIAAVGEVLRFWAAGHLEKGREVTQSGPYRLTRHPLYAGSGIIAIGAAVASASTSAAAIIAVYVGTTLVSAIWHEEENMRAAFGGRYDAYVRSRGGLTERAFSLPRAFKNKEHRTVVGLLLVAAILAVKARWK